MTKATQEKLTGRAKAAAGELTGNDKLKRDGKLDQASASIREKGNEVVDRAKSAVSRDDS